MILVTLLTLWIVYQTATSQEIDAKTGESPQVNIKLSVGNSPGSNPRNQYRMNAHLRPPRGIKPNLTQNYVLLNI